MDKLQERVRQMLFKYPDTRKSDMILMTMLWMDDLDRLIPGLPQEGPSLGDFFRMLNNKRLTNWESAVRIRRSLQADKLKLYGADKITQAERREKEEAMRIKYRRRPLRPTKYNFEGRE